MPAMVHVTTPCNPGLHATGAHYLNADTTAFMQFLQGDLFKDFPTLQFVIPHGGGAVPYHWGRYRGLAHELKQPRSRTPPEQHLLRHLRLPPARRRPADQGDPDRQHPVRLRDDRRGARHRPARPATISTTPSATSRRLPISARERHKVFEGNARRVYPRLDARLKARDPQARRDPGRRYRRIQPARRHRRGTDACAPTRAAGRSHRPRRRRPSRPHRQAHWRRLDHRIPQRGRRGALRHRNAERPHRA